MLTLKLSQSEASPSSFSLHVSLDWTNWSTVYLVLKKSPSGKFVPDGGPAPIDRGIRNSSIIMRSNTFCI